MAQLKNEESTADIAVFDSAFRQDKLVVQLDHGRWLLVLSRNERGDSTAIAVRITREPGWRVAMTASDLDGITFL